MLAIWEVAVAETRRYRRAVGMSGVQGPILDLGRGRHRRHGRAPIWRAPACRWSSSTGTPTTSPPSTRGGCEIEGPIEQFTVQAPAFTPETVQGAFGCIMLCVKAHHTREAARS